MEGGVGECPRQACRRCCSRCCALPLCVVAIHAPSPTQPLKCHTLLWPPGTLFRFPLRTAAAAASSDIKSTPCTPEEVRQLLEAFR